jgi:GTPase SAR1 family protein
LITGPSGAGKTSLISSWWIEHKKKNLDDGLVVDFIGVLHNDVNTVLRYILGSLKKQFAISKDIPSNPDELLHSLSEWLALSTGKGRTVSVWTVSCRVYTTDASRSLCSTVLIKSKTRARICSGCLAFSRTTSV